MNLTTAVSIHNVIAGAATFYRDAPGHKYRSGQCEPTGSWFVTWGPKDPSQRESVLSGVDQVTAEKVALTLNMKFYGQTRRPSGPQEVLVFTNMLKAAAGVAKFARTPPSAEGVENE